MSALLDWWMGGLLSFAGGYFLLIMVPGPNCAVVAQSSLALSGRASLCAITGVAAGASMLSAIVALGCMSFPHHAWLEGLGQWVFAWILIYSGLRTLGRCCAGSTLARLPQRLVAHRFFRLGFLTAFFNPVTAGFVGASLPVLAGQGGFAAASVALVVFLSAMFSFGAVGLLLSRTPVRSAYGRHWRQIDGFLGLCLIGAGAAAGAGFLVM